MSGAYRNAGQDSQGSEVLDSLEAYVREGARRMLAVALEEEVTAFLGRGRYERGKPYRGYRNGHHPARELTVGVGAVEVRVPRVADVPPEVAPDGFQSQVVHRYQRASKGTQELFVRLYLEGLATGDFEPVARRAGGRDDGAVGERGGPAEGAVERGVRDLEAATAGRASLRLRLG